MFHSFCLALASITCAVTIPAAVPIPIIASATGLAAINAKAAFNPVTALDNVVTADTTTLIVLIAKSDATAVPATLIIVSKLLIKNSIPFTISSNTPLNPLII